MIWELIKRDPVWRVMPLFAALWVLAAPNGVLFFTLVPFMMFISFHGFRHCCTLFQAALPIAGKQLFLSRVASLMAFIWLPIS